MNNEKRPEELSRIMSDPRYSEIPMPCMHCENLVELGNQFDPGGWKCKAFPEEIPADVWAFRTPHDNVIPSQTGDYVYEPKVYTEDYGTRRQWHYTSDARWKYVDENEPRG